MSSESKDPFADIPKFDETIRRIVRVPPPEAEQPSITHPVRDEHNDITYRIMSSTHLTPMEVQMVLTQAFKLDDLTSAKQGEEIVIHV